MLYPAARYNHRSHYRNSPRSNPLPHRSNFLSTHTTSTTDDMIKFSFCSDDRFFPTSNLIPEQFDLRPIKPIRPHRVPLPLRVNNKRERRKNRKVKSRTFLFQQDKNKMIESILNDLDYMKKRKRNKGLSETPSPIFRRFIGTLHIIMGEKEVVSKQFRFLSLSTYMYMSVFNLCMLIELYLSLIYFFFLLLSFLLFFCSISIIEP